MAVFSADRQKILDEIVKREGGLENLRIAFWGEAVKSQHDGGNYHWKIGNALVLLDWQTAGKEHLHMTVKAKAKTETKTPRERVVVGCVSQPPQDPPLPRKDVTHLHGPCVSPTFVSDAPYGSREEY